MDLDGAFHGDTENISIISEILSNISIPVQIGGGIRSMEKIDLFLDNPKVARVILGTSAITEPQLLSEAVQGYVIG